MKKIILLMLIIAMLLCSCMRDSNSSNNNSQTDGNNVSQIDNSKPDIPTENQVEAIIDKTIYDSLGVTSDEEIIEGLKKIGWDEIDICDDGKIIVRTSPENYEKIKKDIFNSDEIIESMNGVVGIKEVKTDNFSDFTVIVSNEFSDFDKLGFEMGMQIMLTGYRVAGLTQAEECSFNYEVEE